MKAANFFSQNGSTLRCDLCHHSCLIAPGKTGLCRSRLRTDDKLYSLVYGYPVAVNADPIEKKPLFHFQPGSLTFSLGTYGCNFICPNCQNWDISQAKNLPEKISSLQYYSPEKVVEETLGNDCSSISYTYNEPTIFAEYAIDIMKIARFHDLKNIWVSNGYMSDACLDAIIPLLDAANIDLKSIDEDFYLHNCGAELKYILKNLITLKQNQIHLEITTLLIPGLSDDIDMIKRLAEFIITELNDDTPWHISKFSSPISWKLKKIPSTPDDMLYEAYQIGKEAGLKYVYVGNLPGDEKENTYCPRCGQLAIRRFGYEIDRMDIHGRCSECDKDLDIIE